MRKSNKIISTVLMSLSINSYAGTVICSGTVDMLAYHAPDSMMVRLSSMNAPVTFCKPGQDFSVPGSNYVIDADTCKSIYSSFLSAKMSGKPIQTMYFDGDDVPASCDQWGSWKYAVIRYFTF